MSDPFLLGTKVQYAWDSTCLGYLKRCPRLYYYKIILGWRPKEESIHLRFGKEYHQALHEHEIAKLGGATYQEATRHVLRELLIRTQDWDSDHTYKNRKNLVRTVLWYLEKFKNDAAKTLILDGRAACELSFRFQLDWGPKGWDVNYLLCGHLDRVVEFQEEPYVMDRKTTKYTPGSYYFDGFDPENQMTLYTIAGQVLFQTPVRGVIIDTAQILVDDTRFVRGITYRSPDRLDEWHQDLHYWLALAEEFAIAGYWPMNDTSCDKYGGCEFRKICMKSPQVREKFLGADFEKDKLWNPLEVR